MKKQMCVLPLIPREYLERLEVMFMNYVFCLIALIYIFFIISMTLLSLIFVLLANKEK